MRRLVFPEFEIVDVSIHAPVKDATDNRYPKGRDTLCFNPRTRKGCDLR